jgi:hypothetical protein
LTKPHQPWLAVEALRILKRCPFVCTWKGIYSIRILPPILVLRKHRNRYSLLQVYEIVRDIW